MMMDMTIEGYTGLYMGLWGVAQGLGTGLAHILSGALHTGLIETGLLLPAPAFGLIFTIEAGLILAAIVVLRGISQSTFAQLGQQELNRALIAGAAADVYA